MGAGSVIVADMGKTLAKLSLWSADGMCLARETRPNSPVATPLHAALDVEGISAWMMDTLRGFAAHPVEAIIPVAHGAAVVGIADGQLAFPPLDYEHPIPADAQAAYRAQRDPFAITGSPAFPQGLNLGAQLHVLEACHGDAFRAATLLPYAQYWAWRLSGVAVSEVTSLGCHTDLWAPAAGDFSPMAKKRGWAEQFAPLAQAGDAIGTLRPEIAAATGLSPTVRIHAGLHDSNAALLAARGFAEIADHEATMLSTGTWFVAMRTPGAGASIPVLPEGRDCLINVDAFGQPVPSARFMGGREIEIETGRDAPRLDTPADQPALLAAVADVLASRAMLLPNGAPGFGPFPAHEGRWINRPDDGLARRAALCLYAALVAETSLSLIGAQDTLLIEGRFAAAQPFVRALASLRPDLTIYAAGADNDVSFGALRLVHPALQPQAALTRVEPLADEVRAYAARWRSALV